MYTLTRFVTKEEFLVRQLPLAVFSAVFTEMFFRLGSFTVECVVFLSTWYLVDKVSRSLGPKSQSR